MPKALVERLNLRRPNRFSIQSVGEAGQRSRVVDVLFEDVLPGGGADDREVDLRPAEGDDSSVVSSNSHTDDGQRRVVSLSYSCILICNGPPI